MGIFLICCMWGGLDRSEGVVHARGADPGRVRYGFFGSAYCLCCRETRPADTRDAQ